MNHGAPMDGGPPPRPFTDLTVARDWWAGIAKRHADRASMNADLASLEDRRQKVRLAYEQGGGDAQAHVELKILANLAEAAGAPRDIRANWNDAPPEREWLVEGWLAAHRVAILAGPGGAGKSRLALQLAAGVASGRQWLKARGGGDDDDVVAPTLQTDAAPTVIASWEDELEEFARRLHRFEGGLPPVGRNLHGLDFAGCGPLWGPPRGAHAATVCGWGDSGTWLQRYCERIRAKLLVIDPLAAAYGSDENSRSLVRQFLSALDGWARSSQCAVLVVAHPPKLGKTGPVYSGSTDWHAAVRSMWSLGLQDTGAGEAPCLTSHKGNYVQAGNSELWLAGYPAWYVTDQYEAVRLSTKISGDDSNRKRGRDSGNGADRADRERMPAQF